MIRRAPLSSCCRLPSPLQLLPATRKVCLALLRPLLLLPLLLWLLPLPLMLAAGPIKGFAASCIPCVGVGILPMLLSKHEEGQSLAHTMLQRCVPAAIKQPVTAG